MDFVDVMSGSVSGVHSRAAAQDDLAGVRNGRGKVAVDGVDFVGGDARVRDSLSDAASDTSLVRRRHAAALPVSAAIQ